MKKIFALCFMLLAARVQAVGPFIGYPQLNPPVDQVGEVSISSLTLSPSLGNGRSTLYSKHDSIFWGPGAGNSTSQYSTCFGVGACTNSALGVSSIGLGFFAGSGQIGIESIAIGEQALGQPALAGPNNIAIGQNAMKNVNTANAANNVAIGENTLKTLASYGECTAIGGDALTSITTGFENVAIGKDGQHNMTGGFRNVSIGDQALWSLTGGGVNIGIGDNAGEGNDGVNGGGPEGAHGVNPLSGGMIFIGAQTGVVSSQTVIQDGVAIGYLAHVGCSGCINLDTSNNGQGGAGSNGQTFVGVGIATPTYNIEVHGSSGTWSQSGYSSSMTHAAITASVPANGFGQVISCSDCATVPQCISTGTLALQWALITNRGSPCQ